MPLKDLLAQRRTLIMGVMNLTPDSFSRDGLSGKSPSFHLRRARELVVQGADILDVGGESTRPGAAKVLAAEELKRILPTVRLLVRSLKVPISVDTYKADVAEACLGEGALIINNIMGTRPDRQLLKSVASHEASIVLMHMRGDPRSMQAKTRYKDVVKEVVGELRDCLGICLEMGIKKDRIIIDPGIGFAKTAEQNLEILHRLNEFKVLRRPILVGTSRKSFIGKVLGKEASGRAWGTAATVAVAITKGARIVRVHDVAAMKEVATMTDAII